MTARDILATLALLFTVLALPQFVRSGRTGYVQARAWLLVAVIFGAVSAWLYLKS